MQIIGDFKRSGKALKERKYKPYIAAGITAFSVIAAALLLFFLLFHAEAIIGWFGTVFQILRPIFIGMVIAFLLLPIQRGVFNFFMGAASKWKPKKFKKKKFFGSLSIVFSLLFAALVVYLLTAMVFPQLYLSVVGLVEVVPDYIDTVQTWLLGFFEDNPDIRDVIIPYYNSAAVSFENWLENTILPNFTGIVSNLSSVIGSVVTLAKDLLIAVIVSVYLLARKDLFSAQSKKIVYSIFKPRWGDLIVRETRSAYAILSGFINGKLLDSLIIGVITLICCNLFKFPYPALVATIIGVTNVIPFFGPFIGAVPCVLLILLVDPLKALYFVIFIFILQQFDGNILGPKILGDSTGLASFWVLFSILLFGGLFGFAGMLLGVPVFAMLYSVVRRLVNRSLSHRRLPADTEFYMGATGSMQTVGADENEKTDTEDTSAS